MKTIETKIDLNKSLKQITPIGIMSNLVGMWAAIWDKDVIRHYVFIYGKADDEYFIVQAINTLSGEPNICKLVKLKDMVDWVFLPTREIVEIYRDNTNLKLDIKKAL